MKKNRFASLLASTQSLPDVDNVPSSNIEEEQDGNLRFRPKTGAVASSYTVNLEMKAESLEKQLNEARSQNAAVRIPLDKIQPNPWQPRLVFRDEALTALEDSIRASGVMQPIAVRSHPAEKDVYQLIAGERRTRAARAVGLLEIPAVVLELSEADMAANALAENLVRENLSDYEVGMALVKMQSEFPSKMAMATTFGINRTTLYRLLSVENLPALVHKRLSEQPHLLAGNACYELTKYLSSTKVEDSVLEQLLNELEKGLAQTEVVSRLQKIQQPMNEPAAKAKPAKKPLYLGKTKVGSIENSTAGLTIKLKPQLATPERQAQLVVYLKTLFPECDF